MLRGRRAAIAAAFAIAAAAAVTAGCGGGSSTHALALDPVSAAAAKTQDAGAARIRFSLALSGPQSQSVAVRGTGAIDGTSAELTVGLGGALHGFPGVPAGTSVKEIFLHRNGDYLVYVKSGLVAKYLPVGTEWVELDISKLGKSAGLDLGKLFSASQLQPSDLLSVLKGEGAEIHTVGSATVAGVATTHYHLLIDTAKALRSKGLASPLLAGATAKVPTIPADVWIGKDGLLRRITLSYGVAQAHVAMTMSLFDYGADLSIAAPPSGTVFDATPLAQSGIGKALTH